MMARRGRAGVTLVETAVVMLILGILLAAALPLTTTATYWSLRVSANQLAVNMREARSRAIMEARNCYLVFFQFNHRYRLVYPEGRSFVLLPEGVEIAFLNFPLVARMDNRPTLYFRLTGAPNRGGHVALRNKRGNRLYVIVTPVTGRVRISQMPP